MPPCRWPALAPAPALAPPRSGAAARLHRHENATKRLRIRSLVGRIAEVDGETRASGDRRRDRHASDRRFDVLDVAHRETVARDGLSVRDDIDVLAAGLPLGERAAGARHLAQQAFERHADAFDLLQVLAEDFDADRRADPVVNMSMRVRIGGAMAIW